MDIDLELKKIGIFPVRQLNQEEVNFIANATAEKLAHAFSLLQYDFIYTKLCKCNMYIAKLPIGYSKANYFYKNKSIYFNETCDLTIVDEFIVHECIHYIQDERNSDGSLYRMGLCEFDKFKVYGFALNEAVIQYMTSIALDKPKILKPIFDMELYTISDVYYPILCGLIFQIVYFTGEQSLIKSMLTNNDDFKIAFETIYGIDAFSFLRNHLDIMLDCRHKTIANSTYLNLPSISSFHKCIIRKKQKFLIKHIQYSFFEIQKLLYKTYFNDLYKTIKTQKDLNCFVEKLNNFEPLVAKMNGNTEFEDYKNKMLDKCKFKVS